GWKNLRGQTLLHLLTTKPDPQVIEYLIAHGMEVDAKDLKGNTPLRLTTIPGDPLAAYLLLKAGAAFDEGLGHELLHLALKSAHSDLLWLLIFETQVDPPVYLSEKILDMAIKISSIDLLSELFLKRQVLGSLRQMRLVGSLLLLQGAPLSLFSASQLEQAILH